MDLEVIQFMKVSVDISTRKGFMINVSLYKKQFTMGSFLANPQVMSGRPIETNRIKWPLTTT